MALGTLYDSGALAINTAEYQWADYFVFALSVLSALVFALFGICFFLDKKCPTFLSFFPVIWSIGRLILNYTKFNGIALASENIVDILTMAFFMVFWLYHLKILGNQNPIKTLSRVFFFGSCAALLGLVSTLPRFFADYSMRVDFISTLPTISFSNITGAVYILCFIGVLYMQKVENNVATAANTQTDDISNENNNDDYPQFTIEVIEDFNPENTDTSDNSNDI